MSITVKHDVRQALSDFMPANQPGVYVSVDGQYGSTGKGLINGLIGEVCGRYIDWVVSNAGPNSGHTYIDTRTGEDVPVVLKQLPTSAVVAKLIHGKPNAPNVLLSAGAIINPHILAHEIDMYDMAYVSVHRNAAIIDDEAMQSDKENVRAIASTGMGVGPALIAKMQRKEGATFSHNFEARAKSEAGLGDLPHIRHNDGNHFFVEVSQGFSLGINSGFYPHVTTRECTVMQAMADACLRPQLFRSSIMSVRTFPIRVGSTENSSGPYYVDQNEISWDDLGVKPELTTVTKRVRRVFTWSKTQFCEALMANGPNVIFLNFCNYLEPGSIDKFVKDNIVDPYIRVLGRDPTVLLGFGPKSSDVHLYTR